jgi:hypothetical protein
MEILVSGCSISAGFGFPCGKNEPKLWCNQVAAHYGANLTNVSIPGYDNTGIFLNALREFSKKKYDLILLQLTSFNRIVVSPNVNGRINVVNSSFIPDEHWKDWIDSTDFKVFQRMLININGGLEHWDRLMNLLISTQNLSKELNLNVKFINGLLTWDRGLFENRKSTFLETYFNFDQHTDFEIDRTKEKIAQDLLQLDLDLWINPFDSFSQTQIDNAPLDSHPGEKSHDLYASTVLKSLITQ